MKSVLVLIGTIMGIFSFCPGASIAVFPLIFGFYENLFWQKDRPHLAYLLCGGFLAAVMIFSSPASKLMGVPSFRVYVYSLLTGITLTAVRLLLKKIHYWKLPLYLFLSFGLLLSLFALPKMGSNAHAPIIQGLFTSISFLIPGFGVVERLTPGLFFSIGFCLGFTLLHFFLLTPWKNHRDKTLSFYLGLLIGSLPAIWPYSPFIHFIHQETMVHLTNIQMVISFFFFMLGYFSISKFQKWKNKSG